MCKTSVKYINAQLFSIDRLCLHFDHMNKDLLPLFATMAASNSPDLWPVMRTFFMRAKFPERAGSSKDSSNDRFIGLLHWLAQFSGVQEALKGVLKVLGGAHGRGNVHSLLSSGMEQYSVSTSNLAPFFTEGAPLSNLPDPIRALPAWILSALAKGQLGIFALRVLLCKRVILHTQVEDFRLPSCNTTSQPIRQVLYGLLLHMKDRYRTTDSTDAEENLCSAYCVQEFGRQHLEVCPSSVPAILKESALHLPLETLNKVHVQIRLQVLLDTLGVEKSILPLVPSHLQLPVCVTCYWLTHAKPKPDLQHLQSLLLGIVIGEFSRQEHKGKFHRGQRVVWKRVRQLRVKRQSGGPDRDVAHTFCQWQSCLRMSLLLNQLLCFPLSEPECAWLYRGTLVHQVVKEMREGKTLNHLIEGLHPLQQLFEILLGAVKSSVGTGDFFKKRKKKGKKGKRCSQDQKQDQLQSHTERGHKPRETPKQTEHLSNRSAALECEDDEDDEEREDEEDEDFDDDDDYGEELQWLEEVHLVRVRFTTTHRITCGRPLIRVRKPHRGLW
ncbi:hypothetical protein AGOR_G00205910 [Albula goreensis]|uniref:Uncharacterized protein n=1 Tax=Albula goreensis TaxID=1534307 RepID=A0A8T3CPD7_9TELE|nr:hypothetical protein AGOR_G00205910 [Albula goreensis]